MSYIRNDPEQFADQAAEGFVAAHPDIVRRTPGGVARSTATPQNQVALVIGGGSGHYPAFAGLVGPGLAHAAAMGNTFASPSAQQVYSAAKSVERGAGVLLSYGNYAGDVLNFDLAQERLRSEGIPCETVAVTDDVCSAPPEEAHLRRGIAGDLAVFRAAGWACERGSDLSEVAEIAGRANQRTRTIGVAFSGCTLPGADTPLFEVPAGQMAVGMGIHGEPGLETIPLQDADGIAKLLVDRLLAEVPTDVSNISGSRVGVIVNGLGSIKGEELYLLFGRILPHLENAGLMVVAPEVGEFATSFEMAGVSLTLVWLDDELETAWTSPAWSAAYRSGQVEGEREPLVAADVIEEERHIERAKRAQAREVGVCVANAISAIRDEIDATVDELGRLDAIAGDGDHGIGMQRGSTAAALEAARAEAAGASGGNVLMLAGDAWADHAGGTSGALWGAGLRAAGTVIGDADSVSARLAAQAVGAARDAIVGYGKAEIGDKTLVDALTPFAEALAQQAEQGASLVNAWSAAADAATSAAQATADLVPRRGRSRSHSDKSLGTPDPGAISLASTMQAVSRTLREHREKE